MKERVAGHSRAVRITVTGRVQGVGFRPTVHRLATLAALSGSVRNTGRGVVIELEGEPGALERFLERLPEEVPGLARIESIETEEIAAGGREDFVILPSEETGGAGALIPYDVATCAACLDEVRDPGDRRHRYPFTNCTLCGPRYTIVESVPYDRPKTSMKAFEMCPDCRSEYENPSDRRYHAQPNACPVCGPRLFLVDAAGEAIGADDPLDQARLLLRRGKILAVRGIGGFHLAVDARNAAAVRRLRTKKRRRAKPFAVMSPDLRAIRGYARVSPEEQALLESDRRPIVLLDRLRPSSLEEEVAPGIPRVGTMLPYSPLHHLLLDGFTALVMTSGNLSEEPIAKDNREALERLSGMADAFLLHDRDILMSCDDSVVYHRRDGAALVRRSRGYAPDPLPLPGGDTGILAVGAHMKNTFCLTRREEAFLSQHVGDLENLVTYEHFRRCLKHLEELLGVRPSVVACDLHPDYLSTRYAQQLSGVRVERVQHHHAHLASCMTDRELDGEVIGLTLDGTGLGDDGTIWGGEILVGGYGGYRRAARLRPFPLPGGDAAVREPWRTAVGLLLGDLGRDAVTARSGAFAGVDAKLVANVAEAARSGVNTPKTSSLGRLFDGVSALLSICTSIDYDGQAAVELEAAAGEQLSPGWPMPLVEQSGLIELDHRPLLQGLLDGLDRDVPAASLGAAFHASVSAGLVQACVRIRERGGPDRVVMSGGCLLNRRLDLALENELAERGFRVYVHRRVPANDGGICLGQAAVAAWRSNARKSGEP